MTFIELITLSAATWYIAYAVTSTHGPFGMFESIREYLPLGGLTACIICLSLWIAMALVLVTHHSILEGFAVAGMALWIHGYTGWRFGG